MATAAILNLDRGLRKGTTPLNKSPQACVQNRAYTANIFTHFLSFKNVIYTELRQGVKVSKSLQIYITLSPKFFSTPHSKWTTPNYLSPQIHLSTAVAYALDMHKSHPLFTKIHTNCLRDTEHTKNKHNFTLQVQILTSKVKHPLKSANSIQFTTLSGVGEPQISVGKMCIIIIQWYDL